jgi:archaeal flagellin FlaB
VYRNLKNNQQGITGLETAIILIAFVMVASVFAYVVLSAGLYSSQKAKAAIFEGISTAGSCVELRGSVLATVDNSTLQNIIFTVASVSGGNPIDFTDTTVTGNSAALNKTVISYNDDIRSVPSLNWTLQKVSYRNTDNLLDENELFQITVNMTGLSCNVSAYHTFCLEVKPPSGAVLVIERTVPARVSALVNLH